MQNKTKKEEKRQKNELQSTKRSVFNFETEKDEITQINNKKKKKRRQKLQKNM